MKNVKPSPVQQPYQDPSKPISVRVNDLLSKMTLEEKIGQMTLVEKNSLNPEDVTRHKIGAVLSGGGGNPPVNTPSDWLKMINSFKQSATRTRLGIPLLYGVDAVHGHNNVVGTVIFPHNIGLGATRDPDLLYRIGRATAEEMVATGTRWNYAPTVAVPKDIRWGRTYEGFGQDTSLVTSLATAYLRGLQQDDLAAPLSVLATLKHFIGDGGTTWGTATSIYPAIESMGIEVPFEYSIDQGDTRLDEQTLRTVHLAPYIAAIKAGAQAIMPSLSSYSGERMHGHHYLLTELLKGELGFPGFIVSDWGGIDQVDTDYYQAVVKAINAGVDMSMVPTDYQRFQAKIAQAVDSGTIPLKRIDDAVKRILTVKFTMGLFEQPVADRRYQSLVGSAQHRLLAREAVAKSLVLLKNENRTLPLSKSVPTILVAGQWADDIGLQCGGWTVSWLGSSGRTTIGTTILEAIQSTTSPETVVAYAPEGDFSELLEKNGQLAPAEVGLVVVGEMPYAEGFGDRADLTLPAAEISLIERVRRQCKNLVVILISGRPLILTDQLPLMDALIAAWLPGSEGQGVADVLFGDVPFTGKLSYTWPRSMEQVPFKADVPGEDDADPLFPYGFGPSGD